MNFFFGVTVSLIVLFVVYLVANKFQANNDMNYLEELSAQSKQYSFNVTQKNLSIDEAVLDELAELINTEIPEYRAYTITEEKGNNKFTIVIAQARGSQWARYMVQQYVFVLTDKKLNTKEGDKLVQGSKLLEGKVKNTFVLYSIAPANKFKVETLLETLSNAS